MSSVAIIANATHGQEQRRALLSKIGLEGGSMRPLTELRRLWPGEKAPKMSATISPITRGWEATFGELRSVTRPYLGGQVLRIVSSATRTLTGATKAKLREFGLRVPHRGLGTSIHTSSYSAAVDALYPFMRFHKGLITKPFYEYMDEAAGPAAQGARG
jgi:hypothetical protein